MSRRLLALVIALSLAVGAAPASASVPRAALTDIENDVMCVTCHESLAVAQSPQAYEERDYIRGLIAQGLDKPEIERQLVAQYGPSVLARPPARGFDLTVYLIPAAIVLLGLGVLAVVLPRWRRAAREQRSRPRLSPALAPADARRLEEDLSRFDG